MKRLICLLLCLLLSPFALAEEFDQAALEQLKGCDVYMDVNQVDTVVRPQSQPYEGAIDLEDGELMVFLDFIQKPDENATFLRLTLSLTSYEFLAATEMTITVDDKEYTFNVFPEVWEYDLTYYEDYITCMTDESLPMIKAMAKSRKNVFDVRLAGEKVVQGTIVLPLDEIADLYDAYIDFGGAKQDLAWYRELWPVQVTKK